MMKVIKNGGGKNSSHAASPLIGEEEAASWRELLLTDGRYFVGGGASGRVGRGSGYWEDTFASCMLLG